MMRRFTILLLLCVAVMYTFVSCANIGSPDGGRYDEEPPQVIGARPADKAVNVNSKNVSIRFNEFVQLSNASEKVVVSPPQLEVANIRAQGKQVKITLYDSLQLNTTYTVDFSDAIEDYNEGNPMGFYTYSFSTGPVIDTLEVSGHVLTAENLEPVKGILVGLHRVDTAYSDSTFLTKPFLRVSRTNGSGKFVIKGVAHGQYRIFALQDGDGDFRFSQKSEAIAFDTTIYVPSCKPALRMDTCWRDSVYYDSIRVVPYMHYYPDDIILRSFLEAKQDVHLLKTERPGPDWFRMYFTAPLDTLPIIKGLNFDESCLVLDANRTQDTLTYWITDTVFTHSTDSLMMEVRALDTDTLGNLAWKTDTFTLVSRTPWAKIKAERQEKIDEWVKEREKKAKKSKEPLPPAKNPHEEQFLSLKITPTGSMAPNKNVLIQATEPITAIDTSMIHLYVHRDSNLYEEPCLILPTPHNSKSYTLYAEWVPGSRYAIVVDSLALTGVMGASCHKERKEIQVNKLEDYGTLVVNLMSTDTCMIVQLLDRSDKPIAWQRVSSAGSVEFYFLRPDNYYLRCFADLNGNNVWDVGEYASCTHPEQVYYFPKPMIVRAGWDLEQDWDIRGIPVLNQKPAELIKQKADKQKTPKERNKEREREKANRK